MEKWNYLPIEAKHNYNDQVESSYGAHPASYAMGTGGKADHSPPTSAEVKKIFIYTSTPPYAFMA
jgi:hypothetical protein